MCQQQDILMRVLVPGLCLLYLVVVEVTVDGEPVCAQALQVSGRVCVCPPLNSHEGSVTPGPQQLRGVLFLLATHVTALGTHVNKITPLTSHAPDSASYPCVQEKPLCAL